MSEPKFEIGQLVTHVRSRGIYKILRTPPLAVIEKDMSPAYVYQSIYTDSRWWIRPQWEMEDGRFQPYPESKFDGEQR